MEAKKNEDPIVRLKSYMIENDLATNEDLDQIDEEAVTDFLAELADQGLLVAG